MDDPHLAAPTAYMLALSLAAATGSQAAEDPHGIWVYTQSDNPRPGRLYRPRRNPLDNYSNYQATVSLPGWSD